ncbi:ABC transporter ATP-binding protein [Novispirillum sp. DQ9]|uniref:ABC transporter ATP-binding protein n=1 Tax=Novispirillum sp. DQ9 TaxID=3398612 RepID=UPI003C7ACBEB
MAEAVILDTVRKTYGRTTVLHDVSLRLAEGERLALLGHNGAGKTTMMKLMLGLIRPDGGRVTVLGRDPVAMRPSVGFLPESVAFHDAMTGREVIAFYARLKRRPAAEGMALLDRVGLLHAAGRRVATYSKGMRQRLGLAQALLGEPRLLLLDEPTTGLDPDLRQAFYAIIAELKRGGTAVLLSSHILTELEERTDRIAIVEHGHLRASGTLENLRARAGLPVRLRVSTTGAAAVVAALVTERLGGLPVVAVEPRALTLHCAPVDKMAALRAVTALGEAVRDVDIQLPSLDDVYAHFTGIRLAEAAPEQAEAAQ